MCELYQWFLFQSAAQLIVTLAVASQWPPHCGQRQHRLILADHPLCHLIAQAQINQSCHHQRRGQRNPVQLVKAENTWTQMVRITSTSVNGTMCQWRKAGRKADRVPVKWKTESKNYAWRTPTWNIRLRFCQKNSAYWRSCSLRMLEAHLMGIVLWQTFLLRQWRLTWPRMWSVWWSTKTMDILLQLRSDELLCV